MPINFSLTNDGDVRGDQLPTKHDEGLFLLSFFKQLIAALLLAACISAVVSGALEAATYLLAVRSLQLRRKLDFTDSRSLKAILVYAVNA